MAWRCSGTSNAELVQKLRAANIIRSPLVQHAMLATDRAHYTAHAYEDAPQPIPRPAHIPAHATISAPHVHAMALQVLLPRLRHDVDCCVLDVGCGSGYLMACLARLVGPGKVVGIDHLQYLVDTTRRNLRRDFGYDVEQQQQQQHGEGQEEDQKGEEDKARMVVVHGDGREGVPYHGPYDAIHVGAAAPEIPSALVEQLKSPGIMFVPVGESGADQYVYIVEKDSQGAVTKTRSHGVRYVPLTDAEQEETR